MWVIPNVSGAGQRPAVNIDLARTLEVARADSGRDLDRYAVYAVFGPLAVDTNDWVPLVEVASDNSDETIGIDRAYAIVDAIVEAVRRGDRVLYMSEI